MSGQENNLGVEETEARKEQGLRGDQGEGMKGMMRVVLESEGRSSDDGKEGKCGSRRGEWQMAFAFPYRAFLQLLLQRLSTPDPFPPKYQARLLWVF